MTRTSVATVCVAALAVAPPVQADQVVLATGARVEGQLDRGTTDSRSNLAIQSPYGRIVLDRNRVTRAAAETPAEVEYRRRAPSVSDTVEAQFALAQWCRNNGVADGMRRHLQRVLELEPDHAEARMLLGYQQIDGQWMTRDDVLAARGLVRWKGQYRTPQEVALLERAEKAEAEAIAWRNRLAGWRADLDSRNRETARAAEEAFAALEDPAATPELLKLLASEESPLVRRLFVATLGRMGTGDGLAVIARHAIGDPDPEVRAEAVDRLVADGRPGIAIPFVGALKADNPPIINNAAWALGRIGSDSAIEPLIDALVTTHKRQVGNDSGGDQYSMTFGPTAGSFGFGGGGPKTEKRDSRNPQVLEALVHLTGVNFQYDKSQWRAWLASKQVAQNIDLRRDL